MIKSDPEKSVTYSIEYTTSIKQPRFGNLTKCLSIILMKISSPDSDLALKL